MKSCLYYFLFHSLLRSESLFQGFGVFCFQIVFELGPNGIRMVDEIGRTGVIFGEIGGNDNDYQLSKLLAILKHVSRDPLLFPLLACCCIMPDNLGRKSPFCVAG